MDLQTAQTIQRGEFSDYDFLELVVFAHKAGWEGFDYAVTDYPPRFERDGYEYGEESAALQVLLERFDGDISAFWREAGAQEAYNRHLDEMRSHLLG